MRDVVIGVYSQGLLCPRIVMMDDELLGQAF